MRKLKLGRHDIEVSISNGKRMAKYGDIKKMLNLSLDYNDSYFVDASIITHTLFDKVYVSCDETLEEKAIFTALCRVGIYPLIDEVCEVDLRKISYVKEFECSLKHKGIKSVQ